MAQERGPVLWSVDARGVARVTLNRPDVYNAYNGEMIASLLDTYDALTKHNLRAIVLRQSNEAAEGFAAFLKKRPPRWAPTK